MDPAETGPVAEPGIGDQQPRVDAGVSGNHQLQVGYGTVEFPELGDREHELPVMVATLRSWYGRHVGEPAWEDFIRGLSAVSP